MKDDFCIFILTHGRPDRVHTYDSLMKSGYTGKVYIVIDDEDKTEAGYRQRFGDKVLQFNKTEWAAKTDEGDNFRHRKAIVYARNACWELAKQIGCRYFVQFDDDYTEFTLRYYNGSNEVKIRKGMDEVLAALLEFFASIPAISIAMSQGADFNGSPDASLRRKCMNSWFCDLQKPFSFYGHMNEDVSAYVSYGLRGNLLFTVMQAKLQQKPTQVTAGGMSDLYLESGTYVKSFYSVMCAPSCVKIGSLSNCKEGGGRIHHKINWHNAAPKILRETTKKI